MCLNFSAVVADDPECRVDRDCPRQLTCMRETCKNPCIVSNPCSRSQQCVVTDTASSIRSVACVCPEGTLAGYGGICEHGKFDNIFVKHVLNLIFFSVDARPQCETDLDCDITKKCSFGTCVLACSLINCGHNAICMSKFHNGECECLSGYRGNPQIACTKGRF